jgi:hypothetical protein
VDRRELASGEREKDDAEWGHKGLKVSDLRHPEESVLFGAMFSE